MFQQTEAPGGSPDFWEQNWRDGDFDESARFCDIDPLRPMFARHARSGSVLLDGGCGRGPYVAYQAGRGVHALGVDFATETLAGVRRQHPELPLAAGNVARLPLRGGVIDTYFSNGVVEHFEGGPHAALAEARRVLAPDGMLLISVPYLSPLRWVLAPLRTEWRRTAVHRIDQPPPGWVFFQYAYRPEEFADLVRNAGFEVLRRRGYSILWGLYEVPVAGPALQRRLAARAGDRGERPHQEPPAPAPDPPVSLAKRLIVSEDDSVPVLGTAVRFLRWLAANMMMYECARGDADA